MSKILKQIIILVCLIGVLVLPYFVFAKETDALKRLNAVAGGSFKEYGDATSISGIIGTIITAVLSLLGVIFLVLMIYGGFTWMTGRGEEEKMRKAQDIIRMAIIGLVIVIAAYAITQFVYTYIIDKNILNLVA
ncbi:MAG: hypothetical protein ABIE43_01375 [Patescibacteria group bacterium]